MASIEERLDLHLRECSEKSVQNAEKLARIDASLVQVKDRTDRIFQMMENPSGVDIERIHGIEMTMKDIEHRLARNTESRENTAGWFKFIKERMVWILLPVILMALWGWLEAHGIMGVVTDNGSQEQQEEKKE